MSRWCFSWGGGTFHGGGVDFGPYLVEGQQEGWHLWGGGWLNQRSCCSQNHWSSNTTSRLFQRQRSNKQSTNLCHFLQVQLKKEDCITNNGPLDWTFGLLRTAPLITLDCLRAFAICYTNYCPFLWQKKKKKKPQNKTHTHTQRRKDSVWWDHLAWLDCEAEVTSIFREQFPEMLSHKVSDLG